MGCVDDVFEPNDTFGTALPTTGATGLVASKASSDFWTVTVPVGESIQFDLRSIGDHACPRAASLVREVLDRRVYDNTDDLKQSDCIQRVRNGKLNNETELWVRRIRDEAFVESRI